MSSLRERVEGLEAKLREREIGLSEATGLTPAALLNEIADELAAALAADGLDGTGRTFTAQQMLDAFRPWAQLLGRQEAQINDFLAGPGAAAPSLHKEGVEPKEYKHFLACNGDRRFPAGEPGHSCSCFNGKHAEEGAGGGPLKSVLAEHWLSGIHCHHAVSPDDSTYDWATCACSKVNLPHRGTVGEAVGTWIEHVLDELAAASPAGREEQEQKP